MVRKSLSYLLHETIILPSFFSLPLKTRKSLDLYTYLISYHIKIFSYKVFFADKSFDSLTIHLSFYPLSKLVLSCVVKQSMVFFFICLVGYLMSSSTRLYRGRVLRPTSDNFQLLRRTLRNHPNKQKNISISDSESVNEAFCEVTSCTLRQAWSQI